MVGATGARRRAAGRQLDGSMERIRGPLRLGRRLPRDRRVALESTAAIEKHQPRMNHSWPAGLAMSDSSVADAFLSQPSIQVPRAYREVAGAQGEEDREFAP